MNYRIVIGKSALKELQDIGPHQHKPIIEAIDALSKNPRPSGCKKLKGEKEVIWRIRIGNYRVLYFIDDNIHVVDVRKVGHRKDVYR